MHDAYFARLTSTGSELLPLPTLQAIGVLTMVYQGLHEFERALPLATEAAEGCRRLLGSQHRDTLAAVGDLGRTLLAMGDYGGFWGPFAFLNSSGR